MNTIPDAHLILGYTDILKKAPPSNRLSIVKDICKRNLIAELAGLNYRLKPKDSMYTNTSWEFQLNELQYFCGGYNSLYNRYFSEIQKFKINYKNYPVLFTRQTCLFGLEEIIQSNIPAIEEFKMSKPEIWESLLKYILSVNTEITKFKEEDNAELESLETLNLKTVVLNELSLNTDPLYIPYRGYKLMVYLDSHPDIGIHLNNYFKITYSFDYDFFVHEILRMYVTNNHDIKEFDFSYNIGNIDPKIFDILSNKYTSSDIIKLLSTRKFPFYKSKESQYFLFDNILLLEKLYSQFINDFWFDYLQDIKTPDGKNKFNIRIFKSIIGYFFETYIRDTINYCFSNAKYYSLMQFNDLKIKLNGQEVEIADLYIRHKQKIIVGQVKSTTIYDREKYTGNIDMFYRHDRSNFFKSFGVDQLVSSIETLNYNIQLLDKGFPIGKRLRVFPVIIFNERALQTPLMSKIFQDRFAELLGDFSNKKIFIYPLTLVHVSDLERLQEFLNINPSEIWNLLSYHCRCPEFMPPFYNSINRKNIKSTHERTFKLFESLISRSNSSEQKSI